MKKQVYTEGQMLSLEMHKPENDKVRPIMRTESGMIAFLHKDCKGYYPYNSIWDCEVVEVKEKFLFVKPVEMLMTAEANEFEAKRKLQALQKPKVHKEKIKINYQFASKVEQLKQA